MKSKWLLFVLLAFVVLLSASLVVAHGDGECEAASLFHGWARATTEGAPNGAAFGMLVNLGSEDDTVVSISTDVAEVAEMHQMVMGDGDVMQMRPVEGGFVVPAHGYLELKPGGYHIMLINLKQPLEAGKMVDLTLTFEHAGEVQLSVPIMDMEAMGDSMEMGGSMEMGESGGSMEMGESGESMSSDMDMGDMHGAEMTWDESCAKMHVIAPWARPAGAGMPNSAAYAVLLNLTAEDDTLVSAQSDVAEAVELHEMVMGDGDVMQMRPIEGGIVVPAGGLAHLMPGGLHIMLIGLKQELKAGETMDITLTFEKAGEMTLTIPIQEPEEEAMPMMSMSMEATPES